MSKVNKVNELISLRKKKKKKFLSPVKKKRMKGNTRTIQKNWKISNFGAKILFDYTHTSVFIDQIISSKMKINSIQFIS